jgi:hypothetical protein
MPDFCLGGGAGVPEDNPKFLIYRASIVSQEVMFSQDFLDMNLEVEPGEGGLRVQKIPEFHICI